MGHFLGLRVYIFDIAMLFLIRMIGWGVLSHVVGVAFNCIGATAIHVYMYQSWHNFWEGDVNICLVVMQSKISKNIHLTCLN